MCSVGSGRLHLDEMRNSVEGFKLPESLAAHVGDATLRIEPTTA